MSDYTPYDAYTMRKCIERQDATIARLEAEKAQKQLIIDDCKRNLKEQDATIASLTRELEEARGMCDLYVDEFHRIIAIADNSEIKGLCERAVFGIKQRIPLIEQRDNLEAEIAALRAELADLKDGLTAAHMDGFASGKAEAKEMLRKRDGQLEELRAKLEQAEKELAAEREKSKCNHEWKEWTSTAGRTRQCIKCGQQYSWFG